ncbi:MAG: DUF1467 family protein [Alphaproteobacteria bacterium]|nr:DUF1467 family protein [Alphaproteobacteria bacterium]MCB9929435.1 DUF1467 family protein [Alphaproteobacteria bacterium]
MNIVTGIAAFIIIWWVVLFAVLPFGVQQNKSPALGEDHGAPVRHRMWIKAGVTTVIAAVLWGGLYLAQEWNVFSFRDISGGYTSMDKPAAK